MRKRYILLIMVVILVVLGVVDFYATRYHRSSMVMNCLSAIIKGEGPKENFPDISTDRVDFKNGEWFVAAHWGISHSGSLMEEIVGDISYGQDSFGRTYFSPFHFCGEIRLKSKEDSYENVNDFIARNKGQHWQLLDPK